MLCDLNCAHLVDYRNGAITLMGAYQGRDFKIKITDGFWHQLRGNLNRKEAEEIIEVSTEKIFSKDKMDMRVYKKRQSAT